MPTRSAARIVTVHDLHFLAHPEWTRQEVRRDYGALASRHVARADHVIVNSRFTAAEVERTLGVDASRLTVCQPGAPDWTPRDNPVRPGYVLFLGTLEPRKNIGCLLDAYALLAATRRSELPDLVLGGRPTPAAAAWLARAQAPPLAAKVRVIGYVPPDRRRSLYEGALALVIPSHHEGFGMPALEAMRTGVPVVAAERGALPEVVGDAGLLVDPEDPRSIATAIARLLDDDTLARRLADAGRSRAAMFTWHATAERVRDAYRRAIEARAARTHD
jgi:glycosyltransferase involved in cell wall biosynthesis